MNNLSLQSPPSDEVKEEKKEAESLEETSKDAVPNLPQDNDSYEKPYYMVFDLETNGIPITSQFGTFFHYKVKEKYKDCKIVQLSYAIYDDNGRNVKEYDALRNPNGKDKFEVTNSDIHGITYERALKEGLEFAEILENFYEDLKKVDYVVIHNSAFDTNVMKSELYSASREDVIEEFNKKKIVCTMRTMVDFCKLPSKFYDEYKWPKLSELYRFIFNKEAENLHNALYDVRNTAKCFFALKNLILLMTEFLEKDFPSIK
jgi:DNA polymerase III epsilon subunit-like protein